MTMKICEVVKNLNATAEDLKKTALNLGSLNTKGKKMRLEMTEYQIKETLKLVQNIIGDLENAEAGEVASIFQKHYQGHEIDQDHLIKECGDCLWMIAEILSAIDCSMSDCMGRNIMKLKARYPDGFDPEKSLHRKAGDI